MDRRRVRLGLTALSCIGVAVALAGCGDRITATRTFTSTSAVTYSFPAPGTPGSYKNLDGNLKNTNGVAVLGSRIHESCFYPKAGVAGVYHCTGYVNTGTKTYDFSGSSRTVEGTFATEYPKSNGRIVISGGLTGHNSAGNEIHQVVITLKP